MSDNPPVEMDIILECVEATQADLMGESHGPERLIVMAAFHELRQRLAALQPAEAPKTHVASQVLR